MIPQEQIEVQIGDIPVPQEQLIPEVTTFNMSSTSTSQQLFDAEETTQSTVEIPSSGSTSTSSDRRLDEFANMLDSCIELLTLVTAQIDSMEKETQNGCDAHHADDEDSMDGSSNDDGTHLGGVRTSD